MEEIELSPEVRVSKVINVYHSEDPWKLFQQGRVSKIELQVGSLKWTLKHLQNTDRVRSAQEQYGYSPDPLKAAVQFLISKNAMYSKLKLANLRADQLHLIFPEMSSLTWDELMDELINYNFQPVLTPFSDIDPESDDEDLYQFASSGGIDLRPFNYTGPELYQFLYRWSVLNVSPGETVPTRKQIVTRADFERLGKDPENFSDLVRMAYLGKILRDSSEELNLIVSSPPLVSASDYLQIRQWLQDQDSMVMKILTYWGITGENLLFRITRAQ